MTRAMIVVDVQNDFCEGGSLAVAGGARVANNIANAIISYKTGPWSNSPMYDFFVATKDFHLPGQSNGGHISDEPDYVNTWPVHCIQGTDGARFHPAIQVVADYFDAIFYKGEGRPDYSGFQGKTLGAYPDRDGTYLLNWLQDHKVDEVDVVGIATDHCVKATAVDAVVNGFTARIPYGLTAAVGGPEIARKVIEDINDFQGIDRLVN